MAEGVLFNIAGRIINSLGPLVEEEIGLLWNFQNDLEDLEITVSTIRDVLLDAEEKQAGSHAVRGWLRKLNDLLYEADDLLDDISTHAQLQELMVQDNKVKKVCIFFSKSNQLGYFHRMGHEIKEIRERFDGIAANIKNFGLFVRPVEARRDWKGNDTTSHLGEEIVLGRENEQKKLKDLLMSNADNEQTVSVVPIVGFGGLGKTTLAQSIFNDEEIEKYFELKMWVCVSDNFNDKVIIRKILEGLPKEIQRKKEPEASVVELLKEIKRKKDLKTDVKQSLVTGLENAIRGKKYLLVLDDVWEDDSEKWSSLKTALKGGAKGSRILITTRKKSVAKTMRAEPYCLGGLDEKASWDLFEQVAFENKKKPESLEGRGREIILKMCGGVPLAVKTMGRLLRSKSSFMNELSKISQRIDDVLPTLKLSYDELPSHLKHCFAYCSLFPKTYELNKTKLINLWIAQGYVESDGDQCLEDIGNEYFMDLLWKSFFQEVRKDEFGNIVGCKMHDLMHDLARSVAEPLTITFPSSKKSINYKRTRHLAVTYHKNSTIKLSLLYKASRIRTFLCPTVDKIYDPVKIDCDAIIKSFKFLRVLDLSRRKLKCVPSSVSKLKHLRYLDLSMNERIKKLPNSITMLVNLQILCLSSCDGLIKLPKLGQLVNLRHFDTSFCERLRSLPRDITSLIKLRHLNIQGCRKFTYLPSGISRLTNLQVLTDFVVSLGPFSWDSSCLDELDGLNKLKGDLTISGLSCGKGIVKEPKTPLIDKENLNSLSLKWRSEGVVNKCDYDVTLESLQPHQNLKQLKMHGCWGPKHPSWMSLLTSLVSLSLSGCSKWKFLVSLSQLPFLENLELQDMNGMEYISVCGEWSEYSRSSMSTTFFPSLKVIRLIKCPNLKAWWGVSSPRLKSLLLLLESMRFFPSLTTMTLYECPNLRGWWKDSSLEIKSLFCSFPLLPSVEIKYCQQLISMPKLPQHSSSKILCCTNDSWESQQQILKLSTSATTSSVLVGSLSIAISKLTTMIFEDVTNLEALPMEGLQALTSLKVLKFIHCDKLKSLSPGVQYLTTVQELSIENCQIFAEDEDGMQWQDLKGLFILFLWNLPKLSSLPLGLQHITTLKELRISNCESLTTLSPVIQHLKTIEKLYIEDCPLCVDDEHGMQWQGLKSLLSLVFWNLPKLSSIPLGLQHVTTLIRLNILSCKSLTTISPIIQDLTTVEELYIEGCPLYVDNEYGMQWEGLESLFLLFFKNLSKVSSLPLGLQHVTTLKELWIVSCESLTTLSPVIQHLTTVEKLYIEGCPLCVDDEHGMQWQGLQNLLLLSFKNLVKLSSLPLGLQHVTTLEELRISSCEILVSIPEWIHQCKSLKVLEIDHCPNLASLPVETCEPWSLLRLSIWRCPILSLKCVRTKGEYWPQIAHIPNLSV